jgi:hypothetical protein
MFGNDRELEWLETRKEAAIASESWDAYCDAQKPLGDHYRKYIWMARHYDFLKERGFLLMKTVIDPKARQWSDIITDARFLPTPTNERGSKNVIPPGFIFCSGLSDKSVPTGNIGGTRGYRDMGDGSKVRTHYGARFYGTYVAVKARISNQFDTVSGHVSSLEAIRRTDGILVTARDSHAIGSNWVALLDLDSPPITDLMPEEDRRLIAENREAELAAWGDND